MTTPRRATAADAAELVRLRAVLLDTPPGPGDWQQAAQLTLTDRLSRQDQTLSAYVVGPPGDLRACAVGTIEQRLGRPGSPDGRVGYVFNVATDPAHRRRGYARACVTELLGWFRAQGVTLVDLRASPEAEPLYRSLGFARTSDPAMRLRI